jgi:hypothetical protein
MYSVCSTKATSYHLGHPNLRQIIVVVNSSAGSVPPRCRQSARLSCNPVPSSTSTVRSSSTCLSTRMYHACSLPLMWAYSRPSPHLSCHHAGLSAPHPSSTPTSESISPQFSRSIPEDLCAYILPFTFLQIVLTVPQRPTLLFVDFNTSMCTQDVRKWSNCGCTVPVGGVKECGKKGTADCKGVTENPISYWSGWCSDHKP